MRVLALSIVLRQARFTTGTAGAVVKAVAFEGNRNAFPCRGAKQPAKDGIVFALDAVFPNEAIVFVVAGGNTEFGVAEDAREHPAQPILFRATASLAIAVLFAGCGADLRNRKQSSKRSKELAFLLQAFQPGTALVITIARGARLANPIRIHRRRCGLWAHERGSCAVRSVYALLVLVAGVTTSTIICIRTDARNGKRGACRPAVLVVAHRVVALVALVWVVSPDAQHAFEC